MSTTSRVNFFPSNRKFFPCARRLRELEKRSLTQETTSESCSGMRVAVDIGGSQQTMIRRLRNEKIDSARIHSGSDFPPRRRRGSRAIIGRNLEDRDWRDDQHQRTAWKFERWIEFRHAGQGRLAERHQRNLEFRDPSKRPNDDTSRSTGKQEQQEGSQPCVRDCKRYEPSNARYSSASTVGCSSERLSE